MKTPWSKSASYASVQNALGSDAHNRTSSNASAQFAARIATSIVQVQLIPTPTGFASTKSCSSCAISRANRSSPVRRYACPSTGQCWQRASSSAHRLGGTSAAGGGATPARRPSSCPARLNMTEDADLKVRTTTVVVQAFRPAGLDDQVPPRGALDDRQQPAQPAGHQLR